jgi:site-specific DNA recombinase
MKHFFAYIRVSIVKQGERGSSLQEQRSAIESYARRHDLTISRWFEEKETAAKRGRRLFSLMLAALEAGEAEGVIMHKIDRSARNLRDWSDLGELIDRGIAVHFAHESVDLKSRGGRLSADIQAVVAADYIRNLRDEVRKGFFGRLKQGLYPLPAPIGYLDRGRGQPKEQDPIRGSLVRAAFELYASGGYSLEELGEELYRRGLRTRSGKPLSCSTLSDLLHNPFYFGLIQIRKTGQLFEGIHKPLISKTLFDRVQAVLNGKAAHHGLRHSFLFQRLLLCQHCGYRLSVERQKGHTYYRCQTKTCPTTCLREEAVEHAVTTELEALSLNEREYESLTTLALSLRSEWATTREEERNSVQLNLQNADARFDRLTDAFLDGALDRDSFENRKRTLILERKEMRDRYELLASDNHPAVTKLTEFLELAKSALLSYQSGNMYEKRDLLQIYHLEPRNRSKKRFH